MNLVPPSASITRRSLHMELVERLQEMIVEGILPPGEKVPERTLCEQFGVSRTPMREALKVLAAEGLVDLAPNRGAWVSRITAEELEEVFPVMGALEALSGELACQRISDDQIARIRQTHACMVGHYRAGDLHEYFRANQEIHAAILEAANNATLSAQHRSLASRIRRARYQANMSAERWQAAVREHGEILDALEQRDASRLSQLLRRHLSNKYDTVRQSLPLSDNEPERKTG